VIIGLTFLVTLRENAIASELGGFAPARPPRPGIPPSHKHCLCALTPCKCIFCWLFSCGNFDRRQISARIPLHITGNYHEWPRHANTPYFICCNYNLSRAASTRGLARHGRPPCVSCDVSRSSLIILSRSTLEFVIA